MGKHCESCGWEMKEPAMHALGDVNSVYCVECTHADGSLRTFSEVQKIIADDMVRSQGIDRGEAEKMASELMLRLPAWQGMHDRGRNN